MTQETGAIAPVIVPSSLAPSPAAVPSVPVSAPPGSPSSASPASPASASPASKAAQKPKPAPTTADPERVRAEINAARAKAAREGHPLQRPLATPSQAPVRNAQSLAEETRELDGGGTMRIISAKYDLSGHRERLWAADDGKPVGGARCTQNFRFAEGAKASVRPTMLLCWRTSENRSVVVLTVVKTGSPPMTRSVNALNTQWDRLG
ncbi:hypothetical protein [Paractinoplanes brasiliensis]|uniref:hypothetical protein n=1 Tax=Paractinoplanes brasiliensis TaxID=52695 RepID=UPI00194075CE|nr:hypothetical protein [Actinoplanes brasiliensis]